MMDEEIRQALTEVQEMKKMCGNINMKLTNIVTQRGQDWKKKLEAEYQRGLSEGNDIGYKDGVKDGQNEAWEAARRIALMDTKTSENVTGYFGLFRIMENLTPMQAIEKLKAYEEKQKADNCIEIGDEVEWDGDKYIVTYPNKDINTGVIQDYDLMMWDGSVVDHVKKCSFVKTGNHYDISSILKEMQS